MSVIFAPRQNIDRASQVRNSMEALAMSLMGLKQQQQQQELVSELKGLQNEQAATQWQDMSTPVMQDDVQKPVPSLYEQNRAIRQAAYSKVLASGLDPKVQEQYFKLIDQKYPEIKPEEYEYTDTTTGRSFKVKEGTQEYRLVKMNPKRFERGGASELNKKDQMVEFTNIKTGRQIKVPYGSEKYQKLLDNKNYEEGGEKEKPAEKESNIDRVIDLGDKQRIIYKDGKSEDIKKGASPSSTKVPESMVDNLTEQVITGRLDPAMISKRGGLQQAVFSRIEEVAPGFNLVGANANARYATASANLVTRALGQGVKPLYDELLVAGKRLDNTKSPILNRPLNWAKEMTGDPDIVAFNNLRDDVIAESERILLGTGVLSDSKYLRAVKNVNSAQTYSQLEAAVNNLGIVVDARLEALNRKPFSNTNPNDPQESPFYPGTSLKVGTIEDGYEYKGGDPAKKESWEKVK